MVQGISLSSSSASNALCASLHQTSFLNVRRQDASSGFKKETCRISEEAEERSYQNGSCAARQDLRVRRQKFKLSNNEMISNYAAFTDRGEKLVPFVDVPRVGRPWLGQIELISSGRKASATDRERKTSLWSALSLIFLHRAVCAPSCCDQLLNEATLTGPFSAILAI